MSAALIGSGVGLGLGAAYMAVGMSHVASDHIRAARIAEAAQGGFSETMLQREAQGMGPAALRLARAHDSFADAAAQRGSAQAWADRFGDNVGPAAGRSALTGAREVDCLTQAVYYEARGETPRGQAAVAQVVLNRVHSPSFPKTICGVVFQGAANPGCQFSFACDGSMHRQRELEAWDRARAIAVRALSGVVLPDVGKATHFHTTSVSPVWGPQMLRVAQVGLHIFYRPNPHAPVFRPQNENRAVFVSMPMAPGTNLRLATAIVEKTADVAAAAGRPDGKAATPAVRPALDQPVQVPATAAGAAEPAVATAAMAAAAS